MNHKDFEIGEEIYWRPPDPAYREEGKIIGVSIYGVTIKWSGSSGKYQELNFDELQHFTAGGKLVLLPKHIRKWDKKLNG